MSNILPKYLQFRLTIELTKMLLNQQVSLTNVNKINCRMTHTSETDE